VVNETLCRIGRPELENVIANLVDAGCSLRFVRLRAAARARTEADAQDLIEIDRTLEQIDEARRRLAAVHPNKEQR